MKTIISFLFLILVSFSTSAAVAFSQAKQLQELDLLCITEFPTTSFIGQTESGKFKVRLVHSNGVKYMPIHAGLVTIEDLKIISQKAEILKNLGEISEFEFDIKSCEVFKDGTFRCGNGNKFTGENGTVFELNSLYSQKSSHRFQDIQYEKIQLTAYFLVKGESYFVAMDYSEYECGVSFK